jgi:hypothetical protein
MSHQQLVQWCKGTGTHKPTVLVFISVNEILFENCLIFSQIIVHLLEEQLIIDGLGSLFRGGIYCWRYNRDSWRYTSGKRRRGAGDGLHLGLAKQRISARRHSLVRKVFHYL